MKLMKSFVLACLCLLCAQFATAQKQLKLSVNFIPLNDTVEWNGGDYIVVYDCQMTSDTVAPFTGVARVRKRTGVDTSLRVINIPLTNFAYGDTVMHPWYDTIHSVTQGPYMVGTNTVSFWVIPDSAGAYTPDTTTIQFEVVNLVSVTDPSALQQRLSVYPNPVGHRLQLDYRKDAHKLQSIRVSNLQGQLLQAETTAVKDIDFSGFPAGLYLVEVRYQDGVRGTFRIQHKN